MRFDLDTEIRFPSGDRAGILRKAILNDKNEVGVVVMATEGLVSHRVIVPASLLYEGDGGVTYIDATPDDIDGFQEYEESQTPVVADGWEFSKQASALGELFPATVYEPILPRMETSNVGGAALTITQGTEVWCLDEPWGVVDEIATDDQGQLQGFVGRPDDISRHKLLIPVGLVSEAGAVRVVLNCTPADLPTYAQEIVDDLSEPDQE